MPPLITRDWRLPQFREELFLRYFRWRSSVHDLDHSHYCKTLTAGMSDSEKAWFAFLFGMTYRTPQAYAFWWHFPTLEEIDWDGIDDWNTANWKRCTYGTDARYNKGHFAAQARSVAVWCGAQSLLERVRGLTAGDDPAENFRSLFDGIRQVHKYGRMTGWITCQCLYDVLGLPIDFDNVLIAHPGHDSSTQSIWNGYWTLRNRPDKFLGNYATTGYKVTDDDLAEATEGIAAWRRRAEEYTGRPVDVFKWESIWCQFKRLFNPDGSWEYPGHSTGDAVSRYVYYRDAWPEVDWWAFREALLTQEGVVKGQTYRADYNRIFGRTGLLLNLHEMYADVPDGHRRLGLDRNDTLVTDLFADHGLTPPRY